MKHQIDALTATRGVAAILVVIFHYGCTVFPFSVFEHFFRSGNLAVGYFFVLSGFVMYWTYHDRSISYGDYIKRRIARIGPLYWFAMLLAVAYPLYAFYKYGLLLPNKFSLSIILNALFAQAFIPGYALTINSPGWSLSIEMFFYFLFPLLLVLARKNVNRFIWLSIITYVVSQVVHLLMLRVYQPVYPSPLHELIYYHPLFHLSQFMLGVAGAALLIIYKDKHLNLYPLAVFIVIVLLINYMPQNISLHNGFLAPLYVLMITGIAWKNSASLRYSFMLFLGEISYGIYILQEPVHFYANQINTKYIHAAESVFFYGYFFSLILLSALCFHFIEKPLRKKIASL